MKPDTNLMFQGHREIGGGLSGGESVGNLISTFETTYKKNFSTIDEIKRQMEQNKAMKRAMMELENKQQERMQKMVRENSPP